MKSEFTLVHHGFTWALFNYKGELVFASCYGKRQQLKPNQVVTLIALYMLWQQ